MTSLLPLTTSKYFMHFFKTLYRVSFEIRHLKITLFSGKIKYKLQIFALVNKTHIWVFYTGLQSIQPW